MNIKTFKRALTGVLAISLLCVCFRPGEACGPSFVAAIFTYSKHPDLPLDKFAQGRLGVLQPFYARSYLYAAYRQMLGVPFNQKEQQAMLQLWNERLGLRWEPPEEEWIQPWLAARSKVAGIGPAAKIRAFRRREKPNEYESYLNCPQDAFATAAATLTGRIKRFGADSAVIKDWVSAQDVVFANCAEGQTVPDISPVTQDPLLVADREYQRAAASFYAGDFAAATKQFAAIAGQTSSPWREAAEYLIARSLLRQASLGKEEDKKSLLTEAETQLKQILKNQNLASHHQASTRLLNLARLRLHPEERVHELAQAILEKDRGETLKQEVWDYTVLLDQLAGEDPEEAKPRQDIPVAIIADDLTDWIITFQSQDKGSLEHALERFGTRNSLPWLVSALSKAEANQGQAASLLAEAAKVSHQSPAFASVSFHRIRLLMGAGRDDEARQALNEILDTDRTLMAPSALNMFLGQRMILARTLEDFLRDAQRPPAGFSYDEDGRQIPVDTKETERPREETSLLFDQDAVRILNEGVPLDVLSAAAVSKTLPLHLRRDVAQAAWLRATLLNRNEEGTRLIPVLSAFYPQLKELLASYQGANTSEARQFAAAYLALKFPGLRPTVTAGLGRSISINEVDSFRDNWWCLAGTSWPSEVEGTNDQDKTTTSSSRRGRLPVFLTEPQKAAAAKEVITLNGLGVGPNYLSRTASAWARKNPGDPRVPEALHLAVTSTRRGCTDKETGRWSKTAFDLLHQRYANNPWTKKTKYWFKE